MTPKFKSIAEAGDSGEIVRGYLHEPTGDAIACLVLTHGAGGNANGPLLVSLAEELAVQGVAVLRYDLPFRQVKPHGPPSPSNAARDRHGLRDAAGVLRNLIGAKVMIGGQSYGGRQASMLAASDATMCDGLLLMSYPLHAPGKTQLRDEHFEHVGVPVLFVQGSKDPFGTVEELRDSLRRLEVRFDHMVVEGAGHDLGWGGRKRIPELPGEIAKRFVTLFNRNQPG